MASTPLSPLSPLRSEWRDLRTVPRHRYFTSNPVVDRLRRAVPFDHIAISGLDLEGYHIGRGASVDTDLPPAYIEAYDRERLYEIDPLIEKLMAGELVTDAEMFATQPKPERLEQVTSAFNIHNRTLVPVMRSSLVYGAVMFTRQTPFDSEEIAFLALIAPCVHAAVSRPLMERFAAAHLRLSRGEVACLMQASHGLTSEGIARVTGYQNDTVNSYIKSAIKKLGAANRTHAIADAIRRSLIH
ncbi:DNA-binding protein [Rhizobium sp. Leaf384]|uniref:helix-turn-helix transcriptional regulator n=1 Tax=unclassified Rhizobium TaxID=2613769 RepID=UPI000712CBD1|nr:MULTISPECIES: autoinducer binding domain-containing protein [unclassified Rhizobium]KQR75898.1 DNA-binding protein [Rhizobium sp. Leaf341]KQS76507.1 DNA-binding protein [Rhizobium sp. Leaf383]KQS77776.1 DNA-binding protein [Rhizobium sp. Leaf384]